LLRIPFGFNIINIFSCVTSPQWYLPPSPENRQKIAREVSGVEPVSGWTGKYKIVVLILKYFEIISRNFA
jgi:hypothetical protein